MCFFHAMVLVVVGFAHFCCEQLTVPPELFICPLSVLQQPYETGVLASIPMLEMRCWPQRGSVTPLLKVTQEKAELGFKPKS